MKIDTMQISTFISMVVIITAGAILLSTQFALYTADDSKYLENALISNRRKQVLGASTNNVENNQLNSTLCPEQSQVLGYINYRGEKLILDNKNLDQKPTACFKTVEEANSDGYYYVTESK